MENSPLLSIIIPTRNRQKYAISAITSILGISAPDLELVVQDNSDSRDLEEYILNNVDDPRLKYNYTPTPLSFVDNFDAAIGLASGKYLCLIGDDDGVNPEIIEATRWADTNDIDALKPTVSASYLWPESGVSSTLFTNVSTNGVFTIVPFSGKVIRPDPEVEMRKVVQTGGFKYLETEIPRLYHGIVKRECLNKVREKTGAFFGGLSPDIFAALAIANFTKNVVSIDYPLTIAGACKSSGSAESARGEHAGNLEDAPHFRYRGTYKWAEIIPRFYSVETIWADTTVAALKALGRDDILRDFNLPLLAAHCVAAHPKYKRIVLRDMYNSFRIMNKNQLVGTFQFCYSLLLCRPGRGLLIKLIPKRIKRILLVLLRSNVTTINDVKDIVEATNTLTDYLRKNKKRFSDFVS
jgi:glycosyltransferase involved in cell wall biosynthesis